MFLPTKVAASPRLSPPRTTPPWRDLGRATVREALRILEVQGLIRIKTRRAGGAFVRKPDDESVADSVALVIRGRRIRMAALLETREAIEPACAQLGQSTAPTPISSGSTRPTRLSPSTDHSRISFRPT